METTARSDTIPALIAEARRYNGVNIVRHLADALETEHQRAERAWRVAADANESEEDMADERDRYRAAIGEALAYIDHHWLAPFHPGETGYELREIRTCALNEGEGHE